MPTLTTLLTPFKRNNLLHPLRLLRTDLHSLLTRYPTDWTTFNQQILASAIYIFFTNLLPGITFASDLNVLTDRNWGTIEVVSQAHSLIKICSDHSATSLELISDA